MARTYSWDDETAEPGAAVREPGALDEIGKALDQAIEREREKASRRLAELAAAAKEKEGLARHSALLDEVRLASLQIGERVGGHLDTARRCRDAIREVARRLDDECRQASELDRGLRELKRKADEETLRIRQELESRFGIVLPLPDAMMEAAEAGNAELAELNAYYERLVAADPGAARIEEPEPEEPQGPQALAAELMSEAEASPAVPSAELFEAGPFTNASPARAAGGAARGTDAPDEAALLADDPLAAGGFSWGEPRPGTLRDAPATASPLAGEDAASEPGDGTPGDGSSHATDAAPRSAAATLEACRGAHPVADGSEFHFFGLKGRLVLDCESLFARMIRGVEEANALAQVAAFAAPGKERFDAKGRILDVQDVLRATVQAAVRFCDSVSCELPDRAIGILSLTRIRDLAAKLSTGNWSDPQDLASFAADLSALTEALAEVFAAPDFADSLLEQLGAAA